ncbi:MAG: biotin transporter BioY [Phycisphaerae bacterium]|nr:biotin transporter BioY [Phycisphaerae bacterium]
MLTANSSVVGAPSIRIRIAKEAGLVLAASLLIAVCAWIQVSGPVPFTMQTFAVMLIAGSLGGTRAVAAVGVYLIEGAAGLPVFANGTAGPAYFATATGGYLIGFLLSAGLVGLTVERMRLHGVTSLTTAFLVGHVVILASGFAWLSFWVGIESALSLGVVPFLVTSVLKSAMAAYGVTIWRRSTSK